MNPTDEQLAALDMFASGVSMKITAAAGTGKTTTLRLLANEAARRRTGRMIYTTFSKRLVEEAKGKFPSGVRVVTNHGMAFGATGAAYANAGRLRGRLLVSDLQMFGWNDQVFAPYADSRVGTFGVIETFNRFLQSADDLPSRRHSARSAYTRTRSAVDGQRYADLLASLAAQLWEVSINPSSTLPVTHDLYLKQFCLQRPQLRCSILFVDEHQDSNEVLVDLYRSQEGVQQVCVGDAQQSIYEWRGALNGMEDFDTGYEARLTQSFRFGPAIAECANAVLGNVLESDLRIRGYDAIASTVGEVAVPRCVIARTNCGLMGELVSAAAHNARARVGVVGGVEDLITLTDGASVLIAGGRTGVRELSEFLSWSEVVAAAKDDAYRHLGVLVELVETYTPQGLRTILDGVRGNERDEAACTQLFSTTHKAKGREFASVRLCDDFVGRPPTREREESEGWTMEEGRLLYVAATRAQNALDISACSAMHSAFARQAPAPPQLADAGAGEEPQWFL